jgi:DNA polymerase (family 10)
MDRTGVVRVLDQVASLLELKGENPFRVRAFRTAARTISSGTGDLTAALDDGSLAAARGIGPAILQIVTDLVRHDRSRVFEELRDEVPPRPPRDARDQRDSASRRSASSTNSLASTP